MILWPVKKRRVGQMLRIADWRGKVCSLIFFCVSSFWWSVFVFKVQSFFVCVFLHSNDMCSLIVFFVFFLHSDDVCKSLMLSWASPPLMNHLSEIYFYNPSAFLLHLHLHIFLSSKVKFVSTSWFGFQQCSVAHQHHVKNVEIVKVSKLLNFEKKLIGGIFWPV